MLPTDVAANPVLRKRFLHELAYLDRGMPREEEMSRDSELLESSDGLLIIAWLWPTLLYLPGDDPFSFATSLQQSVSDNLARITPKSTPGEQVAAVENVLQRRSWRQRQETARRFTRLVQWTAEAVDSSVEDLEAHLRWTVPLSEGELGRLRHGTSAFSFSVIIRVCKALQLEFKNGGFHTNPTLLAKAVERSVLAHGVSGQLRFLSSANLANLVKKLPKGASVPDQPEDLGVYQAPRPGSRYAPFHSLLAKDHRPRPRYTLVEIDRFLTANGHKPLPASAWNDRSWWSGNGMNPAGRPQVSAWWGAGYRVRDVETLSSQRGIASVEFEALSGRNEWLAIPQRITEGSYRATGTREVCVYPKLDGLIAGMKVLADVLATRVPSINFDGIAKGMLQYAKAVDRLAERSVARAEGRGETPKDASIRQLTDFLGRVGEADRSQLAQHFTELQGGEPDPVWLTNLLTRARRQGWTINHGTRSNPKWILAQPQERLMGKEQPDSGQI